MKRQNIFLTVMVSIGAILFVLGIVFMTACNFSLSGLIIMWAGLLVFVPICPIYQCIRGYGIMFESKLKTALYVIGIFLTVAVGVGTMLACYPLNLAIDYLRLGGFMIAGFALAAMLINAFIYDTLNKKE